jgi:hypothetical protein
MLCVDPEAVAESTSSVQAASEYKETVSPDVTGDRSIVGVSTLPGLVAGFESVIELISAIKL